MALDTHVAMTTAVSSAVLVSPHYKFPYQRAVQYVGEKFVGEKLLEEFVLESKTFLYEKKSVGTIHQTIRMY